MEKFTNDPTTDTLQADIRKAAQAMGRIKSDKKAKASRENGKLGGYQATVKGKQAKIEKGE